MSTNLPSGPFIKQLIATVGGTDSIDEEYSPLELTDILYLDKVILQCETGIEVGSITISGTSGVDPFKLVYNTKKLPIIGTITGLVDLGTGTLTGVFYDPPLSSDEFSFNNLPMSALENGFTVATDADVTGVATERLLVTLIGTVGPPLSTTSPSLFVEGFGASGKIQIDNSTPLDVAIPDAITIDTTTPLDVVATGVVSVDSVASTVTIAGDVNIPNPVTIDTATPLDVLIDDSTPVEINVDAITIETVTINEPIPIKNDPENPSLVVQLL